MVTLRRYVSARLQALLMRSNRNFVDSVQSDADMRR